MPVRARPRTRRAHPRHPPGRLRVTRWARLSSVRVATPHPTPPSPPARPKVRVPVNRRALPKRLPPRPTAAVTRRSHPAGVNQSMAPATQTAASTGRPNARMGRVRSGGNGGGGGGWRGRHTRRRPPPPRWRPHLPTVLLDPLPKQRANEGASAAAAVDVAKRREGPRRGRGGHRPTRWSRQQRCGCPTATRRENA